MSWYMKTDLWLYGVSTFSSFPLLHVSKCLMAQAHKPSNIHQLSTDNDNKALGAIPRSLLHSYPGSLISVQSSLSAYPYS